MESLNPEKKLKIDILQPSASLFNMHSLQLMQQFLAAGLSPKQAEVSLTNLITPQINFHMIIIIISCVIEPTYNILRLVLVDDHFVSN